MRIRFDEQLEQLNEEMINMGNMIEASIGNAVKALMKNLQKKRWQAMRKLTVQKEKSKTYVLDFYYSSSR